VSSQSGKRKEVQKSAVRKGKTVRSFPHGRGKRIKSSTQSRYRSKFAPALNRPREEKNSAKKEKRGPRGTSSLGKRGNRTFATVANRKKEEQKEQGVKGEKRNVLHSNVTGREKGLILIGPTTVRCKGRRVQKRLHVGGKEKERSISATQY